MGKSRGGETPAFHNSVALECPVLLTGPQYLETDVAP